ncbi:MAG: TolC family protein [Mangrovibacterium sp.]
MRRTKSILILFSLALMPVLLQAGEPWSLRQCIEHAVANNLEHYQYQLSEQSSVITSRQAKLNLLPSLSASSGAGISDGRVVDPATNDVNNGYFLSSSFDLGASVAIFQGFILQNRIGYARYMRETEKWQRVNHADDLAFNVMTAYYNVVYYEGLVEIAREQMKLSEYNVEKTEKLIETGLKAKTDLAEMQATYEKEKLNQMQAENKTDESRLKLVQYLNLPVGQSVEVMSSLADSLLFSVNNPESDSLYQAYVSQSAYVKIAESKLNAATKQVAIARGGYVPSLSLNASLGSSYSETSLNDDGTIIPFRTQLDNNKGQYVGASLSIPIFSKNQVRSQVQQAKLAKEQAKTELETYRQKVYYELMNNTRELQSLYQQYRQTVKQYEAEELAFRVAQRKYDEGILNVIDLLTVKNRLADAKASRLLARLQFVMKDKVIEFYKGNRFWE